MSRPVEDRLRREAHFGTRVVACYAERAPDIDTMLRRAAAANPERDAVVYGETRLSHRALDERATRIGAGLSPPCSR